MELVVTILKALISFINPNPLWRKLRQTDKIIKKDKEIEELKNKLEAFDKTRELKFINNVYLKESTNETFCPKCLDADKKAIHLVDAGNLNYWRCPNCDYNSKKSNTKEYNLYREPKANMGYGFKT